jgi:ribosome-associated protein
MKMVSIKITTEFITLGQLLKEASVVSTGGMVKWFLAEHDVIVNGEEEQRRGKKLYEGDVVSIPEFGDFVVTR